MKAYDCLLLLLFLVCILLTQYKREGFINKDEYFKQTVTFLKKELSLIQEPEKKQKIVNAMNYINFIKTLF
jgi:hypothetical protein